MLTRTKYDASISNKFNIFRGLTDRDPDTFLNRKGFHSLNVLVIGGFDPLIYDMTANVPGSLHDSTVYRLSEFKSYLESRWPRETCIGDSAFAITDVMMMPYPKPEAETDRTKALFNIRLSGARMSMTENIFGKHYIQKKNFNPFPTRNFFVSDSAQSQDN